MCNLRYFCLFVFVLCLVYPSLPVSLYCSFSIASSVLSNVYLPVSLDYPLLIAPSLFSNAYLPVSLDCPFLIAPSVFSNAYLPVSLDCPFLIALRFSLTFIYQCLWIIHY
jgi:hypothetical protein